MPVLPLHRCPREVWHDLIRMVMFDPDGRDTGLLVDAIESGHRRMQRGAPRFDAPVDNYFSAHKGRLISGRMGRGQVCGYALLYTLARALASQKPASLHHTFTKEFGRAVQRRVGRGAGWTELRESWSVFAPVAHLWAVESLCRLSDVSASPDLLDEWLARAERIRLMGEGYRPPRSPSALLDADRSWCLPADMPLPDVDEIDLPHPDLIVADLLKHREA